MTTNNRDFKVKNGLTVGNGITVDGGAVDFSNASSITGITTTVSESDVTQHQAALSVTKSQVSDLASSAPIDHDKVSSIKKAISTGNYPLDLDKISDALMEAYNEMKS